MCGFAGMLCWSGISPEAVEKVRRATALLAHRGPDGQGAWQDSTIALGFRRLKIIDLSAAADQPMTNEDGTLALVFNGEIYNFRELREQLRSQGHKFKSQSDSEVLLHLYEQHGEEMLSKLRGMFAFALWDSRQGRLVLVRDPLGVKPLYFAEFNDSLAFASEIKALFALGVPREFDPVAIDAALTYRYVPPPRSGFLDIEKLPPGNVAVAEGRCVRYRQWWSLASATAQAPRPEELQQRLGQATQRRLMADVPLGAWLSGGIDSGLVVSHLPSPLKTFCAGFEQAEYDERKLARASAQQLKTQHTDFEVPADVFRFLPQVVWHCDEPYFDSSCLPTFVLAQQTKAHVTVVLSGDGGDELFAGYERYLGLQVLSQFAQLPHPLRKLGLFVASLRQSRRGWDRMLRWLERCLAVQQAGHHPYTAAMELFTLEQKRTLYGEGMLEACDECDAREYLENALLRAQQSLSPDEQHPVAATAPGVLQRADLESYLPGDVLHKVDRMSMAHGLEVRSPFLDVDLLSWALSLPDSVRLPGRTSKPLLRAAARRVLPGEVAAARKRGFGVPLDEWFRGPLQRTAASAFEDSPLVADKILKPRYWQALWDEHQHKCAQHGERLYALLALEMWYRTFVSGKVPDSVPAPLNA